MLPVAILAGGLAMRLRPITEKVPKALIEVGGRPFILWQLDYLREQGVTHVVLCVGYLGEKIQHLLGDGREIGLDISYSFDGPVLLGTGGALKRALPALGETFFTLYGDTILPIAYGPIEQAYRQSGKPALMTVFRNDNSFDKSNASFRDGVVDYDKKSPRPAMDYIDYGLGIVTAALFEPYAPGQPFDLADIYVRLSRAGNLAGYEVHERFYEIGSRSGLEDTERYLADRSRRGSPGPKATST